MVVIFPKVPQSFLGILKVPQLPPTRSGYGCKGHDTAVMQYLLRSRKAVKDHTTKVGATNGPETMVCQWWYVDCWYI